MPSRTSLSAGSSDAEKQVLAYVVRVAGIVKLCCPVNTSHAHGWGGGWGGWMDWARRANTDAPAVPWACTIGQEQVSGSMPKFAINVVTILELKVKTSMASFGAY